jgi:prepilin-type N-terminal cleavage/methylation domain-containing protein/prepilin-type processing-associated H-X9-DG protein
MLSRKRGFTLIELLVVIAIIAILAAILFPVFAQARESARAISCLSNVKQCALGAHMYAQDYDETFPRMDNNGSCLYGHETCDTPDWGDARLSKVGTIDGSKVFFFHVIQPYIKNYQIGDCPTIGHTRWAQAIASNNQGINWGGVYDPNKEASGYYYGLLGQQAVNILTISYRAINQNASPTDSYVSFPQGRESAIVRPGENILFTGDSAWDWDTAVDDGIGNSGVWPSIPGGTGGWTPGSGNYCWDWGDGWTWYIHKGSRGHSAYSDPQRGQRQPAYQGMANFGFADGHAKALKFQAAEKCEWDGSQFKFTYWDPRY